MRLVLVDTSVWIDFLRHGESSEGRQLVDLIDRRLARVTGLVQAEVLSGARSAKELATLKRYFFALDSLPDPPDLWSRVGESRYRLARKGCQASIADLVIAVVARHHEASLFTKDTHFGAISTVLPLRLHKVTAH